MQASGTVQRSRMSPTSSITAATCASGNGAVAELVAGIDDLHADRAGVDVALALPVASARVPGAALLGHQREDAAVLLDQVVGRDLGLGIAQPRRAPPRRSACRCSAGRSCPAARCGRRSWGWARRMGVIRARFRISSSSGVTWLRRSAMISTPASATTVPDDPRAANRSPMIATPSAMVASGVIRVSGWSRFAS